jgi:hypothetical protein
MVLSGRLGWFGRRGLRKLFGSRSEAVIRSLPPLRGTSRSLSENLERRYRKHTEVLVALAFRPIPNPAFGPTSLR